MLGQMARAAVAAALQLYSVNGGHAAGGMLQEADVADTPTLFCAWQPLLMLRIWRTRAAAAGRRGGRKGARRGRQGGVPADHAAVRGVHRAVAAAQLLDDALAHAARRAGAPPSAARGSTSPCPRHAYARSLEALVVGRVATSDTIDEATTQTLAAAACAAGVSVLGARRLQGDGAQGGRAPGAGAPAPDRAMRTCPASPPAPPNLLPPSPPCAPCPARSDRARTLPACLRL